METIAILIDFDNYFDNGINNLNSELLEFSFSELITLCEKSFSNFENIEIRLYGGWYQETTLTKQASILQQLLYDVNLFPKIKDNKIIEGKIEMVATLHQIPEFTWGYTHKESDGMKPVRINQDCIDDYCNDNRANCPKYILKKFTKEKGKQCPVPQCTNIHKNVFKGVEQKMVDTLLACDIISISENKLMKGLLIISDDQDILPALALANRLQDFKKNKNIESIILGMKNEVRINFVSKFLEPFNIKTSLLQ